MTGSSGAQVSRGELLAAARQMAGLGYTVIASDGKEPVHRWKYATDACAAVMDRDSANLRALDAIDRGRATSLSVRLDGDLAALDLDFLTPGLTVCFVDEWRKRVGRDPVMVTGKKGGKIFVRLEGKEGVGPDLRVDPVPGSRAWTGPDGGTNALELKRSLSAVYGQHSEGIRYRRYGDFAGLHETVPGELPVVSTGMVGEAFRAAVERLDPFGTLGTGAAAVARVCAAAVHRGDIALGLMTERLDLWGYAEVCGMFRRHGDGALGLLWGDPVVQGLVLAGSEEFAALANQTMAEMLAFSGGLPPGVSIFDTIRADSLTDNLTKGDGK